MKATYEKPALLVEEYELNTAIAAGCDTIVNVGPGDPETGWVCSDYEQILGVGDDTVMTASNTGPWYEGSCSCYLSSGNGTMMTS